MRINRILPTASFGGLGGWYVVIPLFVGHILIKSSKPPWLFSERYGHSPVLVAGPVMIKWVRWRD